MLCYPSLKVSCHANIKSGFVLVGKYVYYSLKRHKGSRFVSGIAGQARYEGFGREIVVWVEFRLSTRKRLSEKQSFIEKPKRETLMAGMAPPSLTLWDFLLQVFLYRIFFFFVKLI